MAEEEPLQLYSKDFNKLIKFLIIRKSHPRKWPPRHHSIRSTYSYPIILLKKSHSHQSIFSVFAYLAVYSPCCLLWRIFVLVISRIRRTFFCPCCRKLLRRCSKDHWDWGIWAVEAKKLRKCSPVRTLGTRFSSKRPNKWSQKQSRRSDGKFYWWNRLRAIYKDIHSERKLLFAKFLFRIKSLKGRWTKQSPRLASLRFSLL